MDVDPMLAATGTAPYTAVIFTSVRLAAADSPEYAARGPPDGRAGPRAARLPRHRERDQRRARRHRVLLGRARPLPGRGRRSVSTSAVQLLGRERWYADYRVRIATVERDYGPTGRGRPAVG